jgi:hypothetical protein
MEHCLDLLKRHDLERTYLQLAFVPHELWFVVEFYWLRKVASKMSLAAHLSSLSEA